VIYDFVVPFFIWGWGEKGGGFPANCYMRAVVIYYKVANSLYRDSLLENEAQVETKRGLIDWTEIQILTLTEGNMRA